jgi:protein-disulfide isomerase
MSNRQARREQQRTTRTTRPTRPAPGRQSGRGGTPPKRSGGPNLFSPLYLGIVAVIIVAMVAVIAVVKISGGGSSDTSLVTKLAQAKADLPTDLIKGTVMGKDDAPLKLVSYEDFQCPFCLKYTAEQENELVNQFVKTGKLQITYKHLPILGKGESTRAAIAAECAGDQNLFWQYHNKLFTVEAQAGQATAEKVDVGRFSDSNLQQYATDLGLDRTKFDTCMGSPDKLTLLTTEQREAKQYGFNGTPAFLINGQPLGSGTPSSIADWQKIFDQVLATPTATGSASPSAAGTAAASPAATSAAASPTVAR